MESGTNRTTIVKTSLAIGVLVVLLASCTNPFVAAIKAQIIEDVEEVFWFDADEIGIDLTYSSDTYSLDASTPIYILVYAIPLPYPFDPASMTVLTDFVITSSGRIVIPKSALPGGASQAMLMLFHDVDGSYVTDSDSDDSADPGRFLKTSLPGNLIDRDDADDIIASPPQDGDTLYDINPAYIVSVGESYSVDFADSSTVSPDGFETADDTPGSWRALSQATYETARNLHALDDIDYLEFTPATTDYYEIRVKETAFDLQVGLYASDSDALNEDFPLAIDTGTAARVINPGGTRLDGSTTYYLRVESPTNGLGPYDVGYFFLAATADASEDDDTIGTATALSLGRANAQTRTIEASDYDYFQIDVAAGFNYVIEIVEDPSYFGFGLDNRGLEFDITFRKADGSGVSMNDATTNLLVIDDPDSVGYGGPGTYYIEVRNITGVIGNEFEIPTGQYTITYTYGPDPNDEQDNPYSGNNEYDLWNEHGPSGFDAVPYIPYGGRGRSRTIYYTEAGQNVEDDEDWLSFSVTDVYNRVYVVVEPVSGADGVVVDFTMYASKLDGSDIVPDTAAPVSSGQWWVSDNSIRGGGLYPLTARSYVDPANPTSVEARWWVKVTRDASYGGNPLTGAYVVKLFGDADSEDDYYISSTDTSDIEVTIYSGADSGTPPVHTGGIDETPYMGTMYSTGGPDFSTRNLMTWDLVGYHMFYRTVFRRDHNGNGEPDGVNVPATDHDFFWFQIDIAELPSFSIVGYSRSNPAIPLKLSFWHLTQAERDAAAVDRVITEAELNAADTPTVVDSTYRTGEEVDKIGDGQAAVTDIAGYADNDYFFFKVQRDDDRTTYVDGNGDTQTYAQHGLYMLWFLD